MKLLLLFIPVIWFSPDVQSELLDDDGHFLYYRFWNPDVQEKVDDYHVWCWGNAALKFTDNDVVRMVNGDWPVYTPMTDEDRALCGPDT